MPQFLGNPFYPNGFPFPDSAITIHINGRDVSLETLKKKYWEEKTSAEEEERLKEYVLYYASAPCFSLEFDNAEQEKNFKTNLSLDDMLDLLLDAGIDPL